MSKSVAEILIDNFLKVVDETGKMPWQKPYKCHCDAFNWSTLKKYSGINRLILPFGEYLTKNQLNEYNEEHKEDYKFIKGIKWFPICYHNVEEHEVTMQEVLSAGAKFEDINKEGFLFVSYPWSYYRVGDKFVKKRSILRYYRVADIKYFKNSKGESFPSRIEDGTVTLTASKPMEVYQNYVDRSGIEVVETKSVPCYKPKYDRVELNPYSKSESFWFSTAFHELAHSTGATSRLNRKLEGLSFDKDSYAKEECIAELASYLLCCECGIEGFKTSGMSVYENSVAYVQFWKEKVRGWGNQFIFICSQAEKAFNYILGEEE